MPERWLHTMVNAAVQAGHAAFTLYDAALDVRHKADSSPVTDADLASEAIILECLARLAPDLPVVAEEQVAGGARPDPGTRFFLVDPLDGTREFIEKRGDFTVNIALVEDDEPVLGVVYAPARSLLYTGDARAGDARRHHQPPDSSVEPSGPTALRVRPARIGDVTAVASRSHASPATADYLTQCGVSRTVSVGSSLKFCLVAEGAADVYPRLGTTMEWDTAAGHAVLTAAGGSVSVAGGARLRYGKPGFRNPWFVATGSFAAPTLPHSMTA